MNLANTVRMMAEKKISPPWDADKADYSGAAKEMTAYAKKSGGIDKKDFLAIANQLASLSKKKSAKVGARMMSSIQGMDTDVRDKMKGILKKYHVTESIIEAWLAEAPEDNEPASPDEASMAKTQLEFIEYAAEEIADYLEKGGDFPEWMQNKLTKVHTAMESLHSSMGEHGEEEMEEARNPNKSGGSGYDLYHKDFSGAMQHAYDYAKKKLGITIDPKEIDDKVATGPRKPSSGKTNTYRLKGDKGTVHIQVANLDNKKYELNMYKEEVELDENKNLLKDYEKYMSQGGKKISNAIDYLLSMSQYKRYTKDQMSKIIGDALRKGIIKKEEVELDLRVNGTVTEGFQMEEKDMNEVFEQMLEEVALDEAPVRDKKSYEAGKKAALAGKKYSENPMPSGSQAYLDWSKGHNAARAKKMGMREEVEETIDALTLEDTLLKIWLGEAEDKEKKLDKVNKKALKKDFDDRKDKDIDNDGDVDDSDEYMHNKRKAVSKAIEKDSDKAEKEVDKEVSDKEDEPKKDVGKSGKQTKVEVNPKLDEEKGEEMTSAEMEKRDEIMKGLEKKKDEFVKKYGDRAKEVMARTAIKMAKKNA
jgi:hypothetical protein